MTPKMTSRGKVSNFESFLSHFPLGPEKPFLSHFNCFAIPAPVAPSADHKFRAEIWEGGERRRVQLLESGNSLNALTCSANSLSCRIPYQSPPSLNASNSSVKRT